MEWSRKPYTRSYWLLGTKYGTNMAHGQLLHGVWIAASWAAWGGYIR
jgi:hypothetical protein